MKRRFVNKMVYMTCSAMFFLGAASTVSANPSGATIVHGNAQISNPNVNTLQVDSSGNTIINWQSFSIGQNEATRFNQASSGNAVLNRVTGADASSILGNLNSNGHVFLINRNGIVIGEHAVIDTASFVASTLDITNQDFLEGNFSFTGSNAGAIVNRGFITAGSGGEIILVAPQIENHGVLSVEDGKILLAAGEKVTISSFDLAGIEFEIQAPENSVLNLGELIAEKGSVGVFAGSIKHEGVIEANGIGTDNEGNIVLQAQSSVEVGNNAKVDANGDNGGSITIQGIEGDTVVRGTIAATGIKGHGGDIKLLGERVGVFGDAYIDASGESGGEVLVGGDYQGKGEIQTSTQTQISSNAEIHADANQSGDGGKVIVWADGFTEAHGAVSAKGGSEKGDGGFVEVSGKGNLTFSGSVNTSAANGEAGTVLFDPRDIVITGTGGIAYDPANDGFVESPTALFTMDAASLQSILGSQNIILQANNDISYQNATLFGGGGDLTLQAGRSINIVATQTGFDLGGGNLTLIANSRLADGVVDLQRGAGAANITIGDGAQFTSVNTAGGNLVMEIRDGAGLTNNTAGSIIINGATMSTSNGDVTFRTDNGVSILGASGVNTGTGSIAIETYSPGRTISIGAPGGDQVVDGGLTGAFTTANLIIGNSTSGNILVTDVFSAGSNINVFSGGDLIFNQGAQDGITADTFNITVDVGGQVVSAAPGVNGDDFVSGFGGSLDITAVDGIRSEINAEQLVFNNTGTGAVDINADFLGTLIIQGGNNSGQGNTVVSNAGDIQIDGDINHSSVSFGLQIASDGNLTNNANITGAGAGSLLGSTAAGTVTNNGVITDSGGVALVSTGIGGTFVNTGSISNAGSANDIIIDANDLQLTAGSIDAGVNAATLLRPNTATPWRFGSAQVLTAAELNTILNNIKIGDASGTVANFSVTETTALANNQNLSIETPGGISFDQTTGPGISGVNQLRLIGASIRSTVGVGTDVIANILDLQTTQGIGTAGAPMVTQVSQLFASNSGALGSILIDNNGGNLSIVPSGIINLAPGSTDEIIINNTGGDLSIDGLIQADGGSITLATTTANDIIVNTDILANGAGAGINLNSAGNIVINGTSVGGPGVDVQSATGGVILNAAGDISLIGGELTNQLVEVSAGNTLTVSAGNNVLLRGGGALQTGVRLVGALGATVSAVTGDISLLAGSGVESEASINADGTIGLGAGGNLTLAGGAGNNSNAVIGNETAGSALTVNVNAGGNISFTGGSGQDAAAAIGTRDSDISVVIGLDTPVGGDLNLVAGSGGVGAGGTGSLAAIGAIETGQATSIVIDLAGSLNMQDNAASGVSAKIGSQNNGGNVSIITGSGSTAGGDINVNNGALTTAGSLSLTTNAGSINGGDIVLNGGVIDVGSLNAATAGRMSWQSGTVSIGGAAASQISGVLSGNASLQLLGNSLTLIGGGVLGQLQLNGALTAPAPTTLNITGATAINGGMVGANINLNALGGLAIGGPLTLNGVIANNGNGVWTGGTDILGGGSFNNQSSGVFTVASANSQVFNPVFNNSGIVVLTTGADNTAAAGATTFLGGYNQDAGVTMLRSAASMIIPNGFDLLAGALNGNGTVVTPILNNVAGTISPGYVDMNNAATADPSMITTQYGLLTIDGDLVMRAGGALRFDLGGSDLTDEFGSGAGVLYDTLNITGNLAVAGNLILRVSPEYRGAIGDCYRLMTFGSLSGDLATVNIRAIPISYVFLPKLGTNGFGMAMIATPYETSIPTNDIEILIRKQDEHLDNLVLIEQERRRQLQKAKQEKQQDEQKRRRAATNCT